jgi:hypothetical protein
MTDIKNAIDFNPNCHENFNNFLKVFFTQNKINPFKELLKSQKAIISGGSVVRSLFDSPSEWQSDDLDIYINAKNCIPLRNFLLKECSSFEIPKPLDDKGKVKKENHTYTQSLFKRSKIIKIIRFYMLQQNSLIQGNCENLHIDMMIVSNSVNLPEVVQKFDLSCCKVFYDGIDETIKGWDLENTIQYKAQLGQYFVPALLNGKKKIQERLEKYKSRGFSIIINMPQNHVYGSYIKPEILSSTHIIDKEEKIKHKFYNLIYSIIFGTIYRTNYKLANNYNLNLAEVVPLSSEEALKMCISPKNKNKIWSPFEASNRVRAQRLEYQDDGFDRYDFNCAEDYLSAGKGIEYNIVINHLRHKYIAIYRVYHNEDEETSEDYEEVSMVNYQKDNEKMQYFCNVELPVFLKLLNVDIENISSEFDYTGLFESLPEDLECFVETEQEDFKVKEFLKNDKNIVVRSGKLLKGYIRKEIIKYIRSKGSFFSGEKIHSVDINKLKDKQYKIYDIVNTGLPHYIIVPHKTAKFLN